jgi:long-chain fatty acid transport protein
MPVSKNLYFGLGIGAPFGLKTDYGSSWAGAAQALSFEVKTLNLNPSLAWRVNDTVSLGFGLDWQKINAKYKRLYAVTNAGTAGVTSAIDISDDTWGWNAGALFNVSPTTKVGVSYRSAMKYTATGNLSLSATPAGAGTLAALTFGLGAATVNASADVKLPDTWILSASQTLNDRWDLLGDLSLTRWSTIPKIDIMYRSGNLNGTLAQSLVTDFRDTWRVALGANYKYSEKATFKFGIAYDQTPVKNPATRLVSLPDNNRVWLSFGVQCKPNKSSAVDVGVTRLFVKDPSINNDQTPARGLVNGTYADSAWILGAQYSVSF